MLPTHILNAIEAANKEGLTLNPQSVEKTLALNVCAVSPVDANLHTFKVGDICITEHHYEALVTILALRKKALGTPQKALQQGQALCAAPSYQGVPGFIDWLDMRILKPIKNQDQLHGKPYYVLNLVKPEDAIAIVASPALPSPPLR